MRFAATTSMILALFAMGCSRSATPRPAPAPVTGRVTQAGKPVSDVVVTFQPLDVGHPGMFALKPDGTFQGELVAGNYMYYVAKGSTPTASAAFAKVDAKFQGPDLSRNIAVTPGQEIQIALD